MSDSEEEVLAVAPDEEAQGEAKEKQKPRHLRDCFHYWEIVDLQSEVGKAEIQKQFKELNPAHQAALKLMKAFKANPPRSRWDRPEQHPSISSEY